MLAMPGQCGRHVYSEKQDGQEADKTYFCFASVVCCNKTRQALQSNWRLSCLFAEVHGGICKFASDIHFAENCTDYITKFTSLLSDADNILHVCHSAVGQSRFATHHFHLLSLPNQSAQSYDVELQMSIVRLPLLNSAGSVIYYLSP